MPAKTRHFRNQILLLFWLYTSDRQKSECSLSNFAYKHFYLERVVEASEISAEAWGCWVRAGQVNEGPRERGSWDIHGHRERYGGPLVTGFDSGQTRIHEVCRGYGPVGDEGWR